MVYNPLSCSGWLADEAGGWVAGGACLKARIGLVILFFLIALISKWGGEEMGIGFSFLFSLIGGMGGYLLLIIFTGSFKIALVVGIVAALVFGYGSGMFLGEGGE